MNLWVKFSFAQIASKTKASESFIGLLQGLAGDLLPLESQKGINESKDLMAEFAASEWLSSVKNSNLRDELRLVRVAAS